MGYEKRMGERLPALLQKEGLRILAIETSCDESSAAVVEGGRRVLALSVASQIDVHALYGGVVPEIASRQHVEAVNGVVAQVLREAPGQIDAVAVTCGPGLVGALLIGVNTAKALAYGWDVPLIPVHHIEGHICANFIAHPQLEPPFTTLVVSGGHTHLVQVKGYGQYAYLGQTLDDAAGEAFDKVARVMGLPYPGGPKLDALAEAGDPLAYTFPRAATEGEYDFSFSGLKTAAIGKWRKVSKEPEYKDADFAAAFRRAVVGALVEKALKAAKAHGGRLALAGGVAANRLLRREVEAGGQAQGIQVFAPPLELCADNAAMIGCAGHYRLQNGVYAGLSLNAQPSLSLV